MYGKHILAIACSGVLSVGMAGSAVAEENAAAEVYPGATSESGAGASQSAQSQASPQSGDAMDDAMAKGEGTSQDEMMEDEATAQTGTTAQDDSSQGQTMAQGGQTQSDRGTSSGTIMAGKEVRNRQGERLGRVAGVVVDESGRIQAIVIGTDGAGGSGQNQYVVVPREGLQMQSQQPRQIGSMAQSQAAGQDQALTRQQRLMSRMAQQLKMQQLEIGLLRQQLAKQEIERQLLGMQSGHGAVHGSINPGGLENFHAQGNPLSRVDTVVVDRFGRVQAIVLKSGIVLAPGGTAGAGAGQQQRSPEFSGFERQTIPGQ